MIDLGEWNNDNLIWDDPIFASAMVTSTGSKNEWIFDTGATDHMSGTAFDEITKQTGTVSVPGQKLSVVACSSVRLQGQLQELKLQRVLHVPALKNTNLISWRKLAEKGLTMEGVGKEIRILNRGVQQAKAVLNPTRNLYLLDLKVSPISAHTATVDENLWHERLGHLPASTLQVLKKLVADLQCLPQAFNSCRSCQLGKATKLPHYSTISKQTFKLELIHSDLSGRYPVEALGGFNYVISFIDDATRFTSVFLLKKKATQLKQLRSSFWLLKLRLVLKFSALDQITEGSISTA